MKPTYTLASLKKAAAPALADRVLAWADPSRLGAVRSSSVRAEVLATGSWSILDCQQSVPEHSRTVKGLAVLRLRQARRWHAGATPDRFLPVRRGPGPPPTRLRRATQALAGLVPRLELTQARRHFP